MAIITPDRFDPLKAYCNVRLQQGVPLVDADVNELDDIRKFEVRAFLKWFVGDGVPEGNDGFRIASFTRAQVVLPGAPQPLPAHDDFQILVGAQSDPVPAGVGAMTTDTTLAPVGKALYNCGRCIVDGLDVIIQKDTNYKDQPLFDAAVAKRLGVPPLVRIPDVAGPVLVYIDVWERLVKPTDVDGNDLILQPLGTESCARTKREWVVRTREGTTVPARGKEGFLENHSYYGLAIINRRMNGSDPLPIAPADITDLRRQGLLIPPSTLIHDTLGVDQAEYGRGEGRPNVSLREAINALIRGELPGTAEQEIQSISERHDDFMSYGFTFDRAGGCIAFWLVQPDGFQGQIVGARWDPVYPGAGFPALAQIRDPQKTYTNLGQPNAVVVPTGDILLLYSGKLSGETSNVFFKSAPDVSSLSAMTGQAASSVATVDHEFPYAVVVPMSGGGGYIVFFWISLMPSGAQLMFRRRLYDASWKENKAKWADDNDVQLSTTVVNTITSPPKAAPIGLFHAIAGSDGDVWVVFAASGADTELMRVPMSGSVSYKTKVTVPGVVGSRDAFLLNDGTGTVWVFFRSTQGIYFQQFTSTSVKPLAEAAVVPGSSQGRLPSAALDHRGGIWLFWSTSDINSSQIVAARWNPVTNAWGAVSPVIKARNQQFAVVTRDSTGVLWVFTWHNSGPNTNRLNFRRIYAEI
jgi:hypothetical protein